MSTALVSAGSLLVGWLGCYINVLCGGLSIAFLQLKYPLELFVNRKEFLPDSRFISHRDMT